MMGAVGEGCVWITGASSGIGEAVSLRLARDGHVVAASARSEDALARLARQAPAGHIAPFPVDVTDRRAVAGTALAIEAGHGPIHTALLNAGTYRPMSAGHFDAAEAERQIAVNLTGTTHALGALLPSMLGHGRGHIAIVASLTSRFGLPRAGVYGATKAGLVNLAQALRVECRDRGVTVQVVNPGFVKTPLTDRNDFAMPFLVPVDRAAAIIAKGLKSDRFEVAFPWPMALGTALLRFLPARLAFGVTARMVRP